MEVNGNRPGVDCVLLQTRVLFLLSRSNATEVWFLMRHARYKQRQSRSKEDIWRYFRKGHTTPSLYPRPSWPLPACTKAGQPPNWSKSRKNRPRGMKLVGKRHKGSDFQGVRRRNLDFQG